MCPAAETHQQQRTEGNQAQAEHGQGRGRQPQPGKGGAPDHGSRQGKTKVGSAARRPAAGVAAG
jgi:hypothetical protein